MNCPSSPRARSSTDLEWYATIVACLQCSGFVGLPGFRRLIDDAPVDVAEVESCSDFTERAFHILKALNDFFELAHKRRPKGHGQQSGTPVDGKGPISARLRNGHSGTSPRKSLIRNVPRRNSVCKGGRQSATTREAWLNRAIVGSPARSRDSGLRKGSLYSIFFSIFGYVLSLVPFIGLKEGTFFAFSGR